MSMTQLSMGGPVSLPGPCRLPHQCPWKYFVQPRLGSTRLPDSLISPQGELLPTLSSDVRWTNSDGPGGEEGSAANPVPTQGPQPKPPGVGMKLAGLFEDKPQNTLLFACEPFAERAHTG